ncbi:MAG: tetratricopeptide repeat protein [Pseudomonadota bacterium]|nr:tetratricopeptide repeat protein [Pseudomonadota bacterium]
MLSVTRHTLCLILLSLSVLACSDQSAEQSPEKSAEFLARAESYFQQAQYKVAIIEVKNALQEDRGNLAAYNLLADIYFQQGNHRASIGVLESLPTTNAESDLLLARNHMALGKANSALSTLRAAYADNKLTDSIAAQTLEAKALVITNDLTAAENLLGKLATRAKLPQELAEVELTKAMLAAKKNEDKQQLAALERAVKLDEGNIDALVMLARYHFNHDQLESAEDLLSQALFQLPSADGMTLQRLQILKAMVATLSRQGRSAEAMVYSKLIAEANPKAQELEVEFQQALEALQSGDLDAANEKLEQLYASNPNQILGSLLGLVRYSQGDFLEASELFQKSIDPETASSQALAVFAETQLRLAKPDAALKAIEMNIRDNSDNPDLLSLYGLALMFSGEQQRSGEVMRAALKLDPTLTRTRLALADLHNRQGEPEAALQQLQQAYEQAPDDLATQTKLLQQYQALSMPQARRQLVNELAAKPAVASQALAGMALLETDPERAEQVIAKAYAKDPTSQYTQNARLISAMQQQDYSAIQRYAEQILKREPNNLLALGAVASALSNAEDQQAALAYLTAYSEASVNHWSADLLLSQYYSRSGDLEQAIPLGESALSRSSFNPTATTNMLRLYQAAASSNLRAGDATAAKQHLLNALQLEPENGQILHLLVNAELAGDNLAQAQKIADQVEETAGNEYISLLIRGDIDKHQGNQQAAVLQYLDAWRLQSNDRLAKVIWSNLEPGSGITREEFLAQWQETLPNSFEALTLKGIQLQQRKQEQQALETYSRSLQLNPNQPIVLNNVAWIRLERGQTREALETAEQAYRLAPKNPAIIDTYAWILFKNGDRAGARSLMEKAVKLAPDNEDIAAHYREIKG